MCQKGLRHIRLLFLPETSQIGLRSIRLLFLPETICFPHFHPCPSFRLVHFNGPIELSIELNSGNSLSQLVNREMNRLLLHSAKNNLKISFKTVLMLRKLWFLIIWHSNQTYSVAYAPAGINLVFVRTFRLLLGQCT